MKYGIKKGFSIGTPKCSSVAIQKVLETAEIMIGEKNLFFKTIIKRRNMVTVGKDLKI